MAVTGGSSGARGEGASCVPPAPASGANVVIFFGCAGIWLAHDVDDLVVVIIVVVVVVGIIFVPVAAGIGALTGAVGILRLYGSDIVGISNCGRGYLNHGH